MERILNDNEKIKKAEDIYFRRNNINRINTVSERKGSIKDKLFLHMLIMFNIVIIVLCVQNKDYIFTENFISNINQIGLDLKARIISFVGEKIEIDMQNNVVENEQINVNEVGEMPEENIVEEINSKESSLSEMEEDINNLKASYVFQKPIEGVITSRFGTRVSENKNVSGYHTGTDIAAEKGTVIKASLGGIVTLVSNEGDYGKHIKIRCNNVTTLYAHCSKIYVEEGQIVAPGQAIGEVGSTGNSTGPHLHFEIRIDDSRFVDPEEII